MFEWLEKFGVTTVLGKIARKLLALLSGVLITQFELPEAVALMVTETLAQVAELVIALLPIIIAQLWSVKANKVSE